MNKKRENVLKYKILKGTHVQTVKVLTAGVKLQLGFSLIPLILSTLWNIRIIQHWMFT